MDHLETLADDDLPVKSVGQWAERKYRLLSYYARMFSTSMKEKWQTRVYIDLFCGPGRSRLGPRGRIVAASPILALSVTDRFDKYVFCDLDHSAIETLKGRVKRDFPLAPVAYVKGDANKSVNRILDAIPYGSKDSGVLSFCFVDPSNTGNLRFSTIRTLADRFVDFLVLVPAYMDAHRNLNNYLARENQRIEQFLGLEDWRTRWEEAQGLGYGFGAFITDQFGRQMRDLGYRYGGVKDTELVRHNERKIPLYRLAFFSRHKLGAEFGREARIRTSIQPRLFE